MGGGQHVVNELVWQGDASHQRVGHTQFMGCTGDVASAGAAFRAPVGQQPAPQRAVAADQDRCLWQDQLLEGVQVVVNALFIPPGQARHIGHQRRLRVVGCHAGHSTEVVWRTHKPDLDDLHRHVFKDGPGLFADRLFVD